MFERLLRPLLRTAIARPGLLLAAAALLCVPAAWQASRIRLDTDLKRLLPADSRAVRWSRELEATVGDGGYFSVILEGDDPKALDRAVEEAARLAGGLTDVGSVEYRVSVEFVRRYKYMLLSSRRMEELLDRVNQLETQVNPSWRTSWSPSRGRSPSRGWTRPTSTESFRAGSSFRPASGTATAACGGCSCGRSTRSRTSA